MNQLATGVPERPRTPAASGCESGSWPLALNVVMLGERHDRLHLKARAVADDDDRPACRASGGERRVQRLGRRRDRRGCDPALGPAGLLVGRRQGLHLVGEDEVRRAGREQRVLAGERHELGVVGGAQHRLAPGRDRAERAGQVDLLEGAGAEHLRVDLPGQGEYRGAIDLRVPQAGEEVRGAGPGDGQAGGGAARELAIGGGGERRGALVADADELQLPVLLAAAQRVGEAEVRVADHSEHVLDAPVDHGARHDVGHRLLVGVLLDDPDEDLAVADLERVGDRLVVEARALAVERAIVEAVPRAAQQAVLDRALAERSALVRAVVVQRRELPVVVDERDRLVPGGDRRDTALGKFGRAEHAVPRRHWSFPPVSRSLRLVLKNCSAADRRSSAASSSA